MNIKPYISVVTPVYNCEKYIEECILSIKNQNYDNYEHIIVDGGSTDRTLEIIDNYKNSYNMKCISEKDEGMYDAINKGFKMANGDIFCWLNADDVYMPWTFKTIAKIFQNNDIDWCTGHNSIINNNGDLVVVPHNNLYKKSWIRKGYYDGRVLYCIQQESTFWRKSLWEYVGEIDTKYKYAGDFWLWRKMSEKAELHSVLCTLASFRIHDNQKTTDMKNYYNELDDLSLFRKVCHKTKIMKLVSRIYSLNSKKMISL